MISSVSKPFGLAALIWAVAGVAICKISAANSALFFTNLIWMAGLYLLSLCDLFALGKTVQGILFLASKRASGVAADGVENHAGRAIQTFYWAILKLACLGVFVLAIVLVFRGGHSGQTMPTAGLLAGVGTVAIVPLLGGLFWSRTING